MESDDFKLVIIPFSEHPCVFLPVEDEFAVLVSKPFSMEKYCEALFRKIIHIGLSESASLLDYHCGKVKIPFIWLNTLEKLIIENINYFDTRKLQHRHTKLISQIDIKRHALESASTNARPNKKKINGFTDEKEYSFSSVKEQLSKYETNDEKIEMLQDHIFDYRQNPPDFVCMKEQSFDKQCEIEIERIEKHETMLQKANAKKSISGKTIKLPFNGDLKVLCDVYYKLMHKKSRNGKPVLPWTITQATDHICNTYFDDKDAALSASTVRTYLSASKTDSRPKADYEINLD